MRNKIAVVVYLLKLIEPQPIIATVIFLNLLTILLQPSCLPFVAILSILLTTISTWEIMNTKLQNAGIDLRLMQLSKFWLNIEIIFVLLIINIPILFIMNIITKDFLHLFNFTLLISTSLLAFKNNVTPAKIILFVLPLLTPFFLAFFNTHQYNSDAYLIYYPYALMFTFLGCILLKTSHHA